MGKNWKTKKIYSLSERDVNLFYTEKSTFEIFVMSGSHTEEPAGNIAIEEIRRDRVAFKDFANRLCLLPYRNPFSKGVRASKGSRTLVSNSSFRINLDREEKLLFVKIKKEIGEIDARDWWKMLRDVLKESREIGKGDIYYLLIPNITKDESNSYNTFLFAGGEILDFNSGFGSVRAPHLDCLIETIEEFKPKLILDLHEGLGKGFYVYINPEKPSALKLGREIIGLMKKENYKIKSDSRYRKMVEEGIFDISCINKRGSLESVIDDNQTLVILESGIDQDLKERVWSHLSAIEVAITKYDFN